MKVSYVTMQFPAASEVFASNDVRWLAANGVEIRVHCLRPSLKNARQMIKERDLENIPVTSSSLARAFKGLGFATSRPGLFWSSLTWLAKRSKDWRQLVKGLLLLPRSFDILREIEREKPDVLHIYWGHYPSIVGWLVQRRLPQIVTSISFVAYDLDTQFGGSRDVAQGADMVRAVAAWNVARIEERFGVDGSQVEVIYNGVDLNRVDELTKGQEKVPGRIVVVARLVKEKGVFEAVEVLAKLRREHPHAHLHILGDGPARRELSSLVEAHGLGQHVKLFGHCDHDTVMQEIARAELLLLPSRAERLPNVVKEGMACNTVCITSPTFGIEELIEHGRTGFVIPWQDVDDMAVTASRVLASEFDVEAMTTAARQHIETAFALTPNCEKYVRRWKSALEQRRFRNNAHRTAKAGRFYQPELNG